MPQSPCGASCVTGGDFRRVTVFGVALRVIAALTVLLSGLLVVAAKPVLRGNTRHAVRRWFACLVRAFGVRIELHGDPKFQATPGRGVLVVSNHVSWLDSLVLDAVQPMAMVAKSDIKGWPVLGGLISAAGSVFIDRERLTRLPETVSDLTAALRAGLAIGANPEGTTWCGISSGRFRPALFQSALDAGVPVRPVALRYRVADGTTARPAAFVGPEDLVTSMRRALRLRGLVVEVHVLPEIAPGRAENRRDLAGLAEAAVSEALGTTVALHKELDLQRA
ncbi:1-acyl-sn-glycerol-3-phosphate acyltransferase [Kutzneria buriramensis]|uniref:1-acyl-sn-glycerol-3-phosphate acyltransferase n=1 Tax=Kutzneria buriramensis TaxID=1045776 RepID=A0A3E0HAR6_9PSEU|nr:1-acyl-sn-glycerol-3-phosphate acyltransferase [Kutzneria buriramensis]